MVGQALAAMVEEDQEQEAGKVGVLEKAREKFGPLCLSLPGELRRVVWEESYLGRERGSQQRLRWVEKLARKKVQESVRDLVRRWVVRQYSDSRMLETWGRGTEEQLLTARLLVLVCEGEGDLGQLFWLQPLIEGLEDWMDLESEEAVLEMSWRLDCLISSCRLCEEEVHRLVDEVYLELGERDPEYLEHLQEVSKEVEKVKTEDLLPGLLSPGEDGVTFWRQLMKAGGKMNSSKLRKVFTDGGKVYVRKWISEGFVSILRKSSLCYLWDILFIHSWNLIIQHRVTLAILLLLRPWVMRVDTFDKLQKTLLQVSNPLPDLFLQEPGLLYTSDLRQCLLHLQRGFTDPPPPSTNFR